MSKTILILEDLWVLFFFPSPFSEVMFLLLFLYICIFLWARPKHASSLSTQGSPSTAEVLGGERWWQQGWLR